MSKAKTYDEVMDLNLFKIASYALKRSVVTSVRGLSVVDHTVQAIDNVAVTVELSTRELKLETEIESKANIAKLEKDLLEIS